MAVHFTEEQQSVIDARNRNLLVSAAAGSGKTAVLVERIIQMITTGDHPMDIDRLLVVTFTNAAAAEMRERIQSAIEEKLALDPENLHLQKQSTLLHKAQITTIDSFCLFVIRNHFHEIGLDPGFRVADEGELRLLQKDTLAELLEQEYETARPQFFACVEHFAGTSNDGRLEMYIEDLYEFSMSYPWPEEWLLQSVADYRMSDPDQLGQTVWGSYLTGYVQMVFQELAQKMEKALQIAERPAGPYMYGELLEREIEMLRHMGEADSLREQYLRMETVAFGRLSSKKDETVDASLRTLVSQIRNEVKKQVEGIRESFFLFSPEQITEGMVRMAPMVEELVHLVIRYKELLDQKKRDANLLDFHDMEHFALQILLHKEGDAVTASKAAEEYQQCFEEILIDEYQDSNLVQEYLLQSISGENLGKYNRFMVGDVKQSIYKFRLARPELFMEKYHSYSRDPGSCQRIDLHKNFRSRVEVLGSVNELFRHLMGKQLGGITYDEDACLYPGAVYPDNTGNETEYLLIAKAEEGKESVRVQEARVIAAKIRELRRNFQITDKESGKLRPVQYRDMVILLRTTSGWAREFKETLQEEGVPAYVSLKTGYFEAPEIREIMQLLHVIDNPLQDIPMFGALKSYFGGFSNEEIAQIRLVGNHEDKKKKHFLYEQMKMDRGERNTKVSAFLEMLEKFRQKAIYTPIHKLIQEIVYDTGYLEYVTAKAGGEQRKANVEMLLTKAAAFEQTSFYGVFHFLRYMEQLEKYEVDYGEADILDENDDVVRIMSIHKSKGLEFPVCFVAGLAKRFNMQDTTGRFVADMDMGIGTDDIDQMLRVQRTMVKKNVVSLKLRLDTLAEEMRILYVAMTRAKEKLILTGMIDGEEKFRESLYRYQELHQGETTPCFSELVKAGSYLDFVMPVLEKAVVVSTESQMQKQIQETYDAYAKRQRLQYYLQTDHAATETLHHLMERMNRTYPYEALAGLTMKTSVSELKKAQMETENGKELFPEKEVVPYLPRFIQEEQKLSGSDRGSAYHKVMELFDFARILSNGDPDAEIRRQLDEMVENGKLSVLWKEAVSVKKLQAFFQSDLAKRMSHAQEAGTLRREQPFVLGISAKRVQKELPEDETVLIQGIMDAFFEENGEIVLMDYKTDAVDQGEELIRRYHTQLDYYTEALERLTHKRVKERVIYSFALKKEIFC